MDKLESWVQAGLVTQEQASAITEFEEGQSSGRLSRGMEVVAYLGAAITLGALVIIMGELYDELSDWTRVGLGAVITTALLFAGQRLSSGASRPSRRASTLASFLAVPGLAMTTALVLEAMDFFDANRDVSVLIVALAALALAYWLWHIIRSALQMVAFAFSAFATIMASIEATLTLPPSWVWALGPAVIGATWLMLGTSGVFTPRRTSLVLGGIGVLLAPLFSTDFEAWALFGIATALVVAWIAVPLTESALMGLAVAALVIYIPATFLEFFEGRTGFTFALLGLGLLLLGYVLLKDKVRVRLRNTDE
jgi:hypothetical protein